MSFHLADEEGPICFLEVRTSLSPRSFNFNLLIPLDEDRQVVRAEFL